nr:uncharacterized protein LOC112490170 isoform X1 [Ziziphus jujuba var. spinosa]
MGRESIEKGGGLLNDPLLPLKRSDGSSGAVECSISSRDSAGRNENRSSFSSATTMVVVTSLVAVCGSYVFVFALWFNIDNWSNDRCHSEWENSRLPRKKMYNGHFRDNLYLRMACHSFLKGFLVAQPWKTSGRMWDGASYVVNPNIAIYFQLLVMCQMEIFVFQLPIIYT